MCLSDPLQLQMAPWPPESWPSAPMTATPGALGLCALSASSTPWVPVQSGASCADMKARNGKSDGFGNSHHSGNLQSQTLPEIFISCMARPAEVSPSPVIQPLLFKGTSGKGSNKDSLYYVPKSALAAILPALLFILRFWPLGHVHSRCSSPKPQK